MHVGAHTLGRARRDASGYNRPWVRNEFGLDNAYFVDLRRRNWRQVGDQPAVVTRSTPMVPISLTTPYMVPPYTNNCSNNSTPLEPVS